MIKINLLNSFAAGSSESLQMAEDMANIKTSFFKNLLVMFLGVVALYGYEFVTIPELQAQLSAIQAEIAEASTFNQKMDSLKKEIEKYEKDLNRLNGQTDFLQKVQKERLLSVDLINKMRETISAKVWLSSIAVTDASVDLKGEAETNTDVNEFNARLAATTYLKDVITTSIERKLNTANNFQIQTFNIRASFVDGKQLLDNGSGELDRIPEKLPEAPAASAPAAGAGQAGQ